MDAWAERGACREPGIDPELFFPVSDSAPQVAAAKVVCARCPVVARCLDWALRAGEPVGIWGGTTPEERRRARLLLNGALAGTQDVLLEHEEHDRHRNRHRHRGG